MFRIFLLLFSFALSVFADDTFDLTKNHFTMYVYGNVIPYYKVFQYIAMITKDGSLDYVLALGVTIVAYFAAKKAHEGDLLGVLKHTTWSLVLAAFLLVPNSTLFIIDKRVDYGLITYNSDVQNNYNISYTSAAEVQHLPLAIAMGASAASIITSYVTEKIDETMSDVDGSDYMYTTYSNVGYGTPLKDILSSTKIGDLYTSAFSTDSNASKIARESLTYIGDCLIDKGLTTNIKYAKYLVGPNEDYINSLNYENFGLSGDEKVTFDNEEVTCKELYDDISDSSNVNTLKKFFVSRFKAMTHPLDMDDSSLEQYTTAVFKNLIDPYNMSAIGDFKQSMVNMAIGLSIPKLFQKYGIGLNGLQITQGVASEKSRMNLINEGLGSFNWMMKVIPQAMNILFVILIALYIPMALVAVVVGTDRGFKILTNYFFGLIAFKSIDIGLAVAHNVANYYSADSIGELYYGMGKNLFNVLNMPYFVGDAAQAAGLAGILGVAAVFITPTVIFWGETKAATGLIGAVKGMYAGTNPDLATAETAKFQGNLEYQEELSHNRGMKYIADRLGIDTAEGAKLYNQMQSEIDAINRGAAFGAIAGKGELGNYAMGSYAKATVADFQTAGAGVVTNGTSIEAIRNGAFSMGAKGMAQTIGYGSEVHLNDAVISGMSNGIMEGAKDNYIGSHITTADARVLGTDSGVQMVAKAEGLLKATDGNGNHIYDSDGHLNQNIFGTGAGDKYIEGLEKQTANSIAKTAGFGSRGTMEDANKAGFYQGVQQAGSMEGIKNAVDNDVNGLNDLYQGAEREARTATNKTIGTGEAVLTDKNGNRISEQKFMGFIKAGAAKGFLAQGLAGEADLEKAFEPMGANGEKRLRGEIAKGLFRSEEANLGNIAGMANLGVSDDEFYKNIREQSIEKGKMAQAHARKMRSKFGDKLDSGGFDKMVDDYAERDVQSFQGTAKAIHKNLQKNSKIYEQNADYGEESKQQSIDKKIETAGGINEAVKLDVDKSGMDTAKLKGNIESWEKLINNPQSLKKLLNELKSKGMDVSNLEGKTGLDFLESLSASNALRFYGQNSIVGADGKVFNGAITPDGKISGKITGGLSKIIDNSNKLDNSNVITNGNFANVPDGFMQRMWDKINKEHPNATQGEKMAMLANEMAKFKKDQSYANAKNNAVFELGEWGAYAVNALETLGIASLVEGVTKGKVKLNTDKLQKEGAVLKDDGWYKGDVKVATKEGYAIDPHTGKVMEKGVFGRTWDGLKETGRKLSPFKQRTEETYNEGYNSNNNKSNSEFKENVTHSSTPSNQSASSINENGKNVNASVLTSEIEALSETGKPSLMNKIAHGATKILGRVAAAGVIYEAGKEGVNTYNNTGSFNKALQTSADTATDIMTLGFTKGYREQVDESIKDAIQDFKKGDYISGAINFIGTPGKGIAGGTGSFAKTIGNGIDFLMPNSAKSFIEDSHAVKDLTNYKAMADNSIQYNQQIPNTNTIPNMAHPSAISPVTASAVQQPSSGQDYHTAVANQIFQAQATKNIAEAMNQFRDLYNPVAPVNGITIPTMGGELSIGNNNGYLQLGDYTTRVPMSDFRSYVAQHPEVAQTLSQVLATSGFNNENVYDKFGRGYEKMDNGQVESLLANMNYIQQTSTKDSQVGLGTIMDYQEKMVEILEEKLASKEKKEIK